MVKSFIVNSKDLLDKKKNPKLSLSVKDILKNKKIRKKKLITKKIDNSIQEIIDTISKKTGCGLQHNGSPCNTCFHTWASDVGLSDNMAHLFWLVLLGIRGDYTEKDIIEGIKEMKLF